MSILFWVNQDIISQKQPSGAVPQNSCPENFNKMLEKYFWKISSLTKSQAYSYYQLPGILSEVFFNDFVNILRKFVKIIHWKNNFSYLVMPTPNYFSAVLISRQTPILFFSNVFMSMTTHWLLWLMLLLSCCYYYCLHCYKITLTWVSIPWVKSQNSKKFYVVVIL